MFFQIITTIVGLFTLGMLIGLAVSASKLDTIARKGTPLTAEEKEDKKTLGGQVAGFTIAFLASITIFYFLLTRWLVVYRATARKWLALIIAVIGAFMLTYYANELKNNMDAKTEEEKTDKTRATIAVSILSLVVLLAGLTFVYMQWNFQDILDKERAYNILQQLNRADRIAAEIRDLNIIQNQALNMAEAECNKYMTGPSELDYQAAQENKLTMCRTTAEQELGKVSKVARAGSIV